MSHCKSTSVSGIDTTDPEDLARYTHAGIQFKIELTESDFVG